MDDSRAINRNFEMKVFKVKLTHMYSIMHVCMHVEKCDGHNYPGIQQINWLVNQSVN